MARLEILKLLKQQERQPRSDFFQRYREHLIDLLSGLPVFPQSKRESPDLQGHDIRQVEPPLDNPICCFRDLLRARFPTILRSELQGGPSQTQQVLQHPFLPLVASIAQVHASAPLGAEPFAGAPEARMTLQTERIATLENSVNEWISLTKPRETHERG